MTNKEALGLVEQEIKGLQKEIRKNAIKVTGINVHAFISGGVLGAGIALNTFAPLDVPGTVVFSATMGAIATLVTMNYTGVFLNDDKYQEKSGNNKKRSQIRFLKDLRKTISDSKAELYDDLETEEFKKKLTKI